MKETDRDRIRNTEKPFEERKGHLLGFVCRRCISLNYGQEGATVDQAVDSVSHDEKQNKMRQFPGPALASHKRVSGRYRGSLCPVGLGSKRCFLIRSLSSFHVVIEIIDGQDDHDHSTHEAPDSEDGDPNGEGSA